VHLTSGANSMHLRIGADSLHLRSGADLRHLRSGADSIHLCTYCGTQSYDFLIYNYKASAIVVLSVF
jgi:hypothetical protein